MGLLLTIGRSNQIWIERTVESEGHQNANEGNDSKKRRTSEDCLKEDCRKASSYVQHYHQTHSRMPSNAIGHQSLHSSQHQVWH